MVAGVQCEVAPKVDAVALGERQSQSESLRKFVHLREWLEHLLVVVFFHPGSSVFKDEANVMICG